MSDDVKPAKEAGEKVEKNNSPKHEGLVLLKDIVGIVVFFVLFTTFGWASFHIPSGSMEPTLEVGDRIFVSKFSYGYNRFSMYFDPAFLPEDRLLESAPKRGDVVVFTLPHKNYNDFIKRVIGLPGDRIQVRHGRLYINDEVVPRALMREVAYTDYSGNQQRAREYEETLPNGVKHLIYERTDRGAADNTPVYVVPADHYFMMGDNRDGSADSRILSDMGYVHKKYLVGRADITTFSLYDCDQGKDIFCPVGIPLGRFFNVID
jgi:signal peptidase I